MRINGKVVDFDIVFADWIRGKGRGCSYAGLFRRYGPGLEVFVTLCKRYHLKIQTDISLLHILLY